MVADKSPDTFFLKGGSNIILGLSRKNCCGDGVQSKNIYINLFGINFLG